MPDTTLGATATATAATALAAPLRLRSGLVLPNRLVKAAMTEGLADREGNPGAWHERLYRRWGASRLGAMVTGNVLVDRRYLELVARDRDLWASVPPTSAALDYTVRGLLLQLAHTPRRLLQVRQLRGADAPRPPVVDVGGRVDHP